MEDCENFYQQVARLRSFDFCPFRLTPAEKCTLSREAYFYRSSTSSIVCIKCRDSFNFECFNATLEHQCGAASASSSWEDINIPIPSPCITPNEDLASETYRLETFLKYPMFEDLTGAEEMASNGFYFDKAWDHIKCYACGFGLSFVNFEPSNAIKAHNTFSLLCESRESDQLHAMRNFLNSEDGKELLENHTENSVKSVIKKRLSNSQSLIVDEVKNDLKALKIKAKEEGVLIGSAENWNIAEQGNNSIDEDTAGTLARDLLDQAEILRETQKENKLCKICLTEDISMAFVPCGHYIVCGICAATLKECPLCREAIQKTLRIYQ
ncbi:baculoviral IAP repeat-containing protein 8-like isoform X2 [Phlebotomus argentipes]|uniref:baculoviral IAP repeat-containing protein 8-like isoform X2 n=1 Tax=Phlebotomus argentipes TaxID=94469 RepID=UPI002892BD2D|nr:baculoviral IAP repeat-containing protein 8-like isoform X2 [Phlebotomus argentipes]